MCDNMEIMQAGLGCPCGVDPGALCNEATACGSYDCRACGCLAAGRTCGVSNEVCTDIVEVRLVKTVTPACVQPGGRVLYTAAARNCSSLPLLRVIFTDPQADRYLVVSTIRVNGVAVSGNLTSGVALPEIGPGGVAVVSFFAVPRADAPTVIENVAHLAYGFDTVCGGQAAQTASNTAVLTVMNPKLTVTKTADRCYVTRREPVITYTLTAENTGNTALTDVVVTDRLTERLEYVAGTTRVNGGAPCDLDPARGVNVGALAVGGAAAVEFQAALTCEEDTL